MSRDLSDMYITRQSNPNGEDMIHKNIDINLLQECNNIERGPPLSQEKKIHEDPAVKHRNPAVKHKDPVVKGLSKYLRFVARKDDCMTNTGQIFNILSKQEADDVALQRNCSEGTKRKFWRVIPKTFCNKIVDGPSKKKKGGHFVGVRGSPQTVRRKNSLKPPASHGQASQRKVRRKSSFQDPFSSSKFPQDQLSKFKNGPWTSNALRVRSHVLVAGASYLVQLLRQRSANEDWGKRRNPPRGRTKRGEFCGTPSDFYILDIGDTAALVTPHPKSAAPPPRLKLRRGYSVHQQCDEDLGLQEPLILLHLQPSDAAGQADHGLRPTSSHAGTENIEDDVNDVQLHEERADNRLLHILIVLLLAANCAGDAHNRCRETQEVGDDSCCPSVILSITSDKDRVPEDLQRVEQVMFLMYSPYTTVSGCWRDR
ncbi:hypothetical protein C0Q70_10873 [Pomacea canaliculata]|uniref:Uncharacterized protein n=1 Tax=Pomacea canaliculata TaxID=400727 RepID=A0A2T7P4F0_POMCA|nr:hypothetical protein C0Q70_10873 [Pomacea canaliculata]